MKAQWKEGSVNSVLGTGKGQYSGNAHTVGELEQTLFEWVDPANLYGALV